MAQFMTLAALQDELAQMGTYSTEYWAKQVHVVPKSTVVDRIEWLTKYVAGRTLLHVGCTGALDKALRESAARCYGIDKDDQPGRADFLAVDLDTLHKGTPFPAYPDVDLVVAGEVLEHLSNPGVFLDAVRATYACPLVLTVPNAFCLAGADWLLKRGRENVNRDHVCYYSYTTLRELLRRAGYDTKAHYWYGGKPYVSEGFIMLAAPTEA